MAQYARPTADISTGSWTTTPLWDKIDEVSADDATTQAQSSNRPSNDTFEVRLSPVTDPLTGSGHIVRIRMYGTSGHTWSAYLYKGTTLVKTLVSGAAVPSSYTTYSYTLTAQEADSITDYTDLRVRIVANGSAAGREYVTWAEMEVPDVVEQHSGSASINGGGSVLGTIRKAALVAATFGILGHVLATGEETFNAYISGGGGLAVVARKDFDRDTVISGGGTVAGGVKKSASLSASISAAGSLVVISEEPRYGDAAIFGGGSVMPVGAKGGLSTAGDAPVLLEPFAISDRDLNGYVGPSGEWVGVSGPSPRIVSQALGMNLTGWGCSRLNAALATANQKVSAVNLKPWRNPIMYTFILVCRYDPVRGLGYALRCMSWGTTWSYRVGVWSPGNQISNIFEITNDNPVAGDVMTLVVDGTSLRLYKNDDLIGQGTDGTITTGNYVAIEVAQMNGVNLPVLDNFSAQDLAAVIGISGGGSLLATSGKGAAGSAIATGGGILAVNGKKAPTADITISGGGTVYVSAQENAWRALVISGGGDIVLTTAAGGTSGASIHGGGMQSVSARVGKRYALFLEGGGSWSMTGDPAFVDTASVHALIHGGGIVSAAGTPAILGDASVFGGGSLAVLYDRNWPYLPEGAIPNADNVCHLVKMEMDFCSRTFGVSPCLATGTPCYNTWRTCRYIQAYDPTTKTYRFVSSDFPQALPNARPYVSEVKYMPTEIKTNLTVNARVSFAMIDEPDADVETDPYWSQRSSHPGTYWKRWLARNVNYKRRIVRIYEGVYGAAESTYVQRWVGKLENATVKGEKVTFEAVDLLKDLTKIEVPPKTNAKLALALPATSNPGQTFTATEDADKFPSTGYVRIDDEIIKYTSVNVSTKTFTIGGSANRGLFGTTIVEHAAKAKVQMAKYYAARNPLEILLDMLLGDAGMKDSWVRDATRTAQNAASYTTAATYIDLNAAQTNSWPSVALIEIEGPQGNEFARYVSKTYIPTTNVNRFVFDSYAGVVTGRALFASDLTAASAGNAIVHLGAFEYVDTDAFYQYRDWPFRDIDFTSVISEPTKLSDLFFEIADLIDAKSWVAENLKITIRKNTVNTPTVGYLVLSDADNIVEDSGAVDLNEKSRITRMSIFWDKIVTGKASDELAYRRLDLAIDPDAEENYAGPEEKVVRCRWIDPYVTLEETVQGYVKNLAVRRIQRCKHAQNLITVKVAEKDAGIVTGSYVRLSTDELLEADGNPISARMYQVVKREKNKDVISLTLLQISPRRMAVIGPAGLPGYPTTTETQKGYCYIADSFGRLSDGSEGYFIW